MHDLTSADVVALARPDAPVGTRFLGRELGVAALFVGGLA